MTLFAWWAWAILAAAIGLAELHAPGSYLIWIALGAALTALIDALFGLSLAGQIGTFAVASAISCIAGYFVYRKLSHRRAAASPLNQRDLGMIGTHGVVCEPLLNGRGKVRLGDTVWLAEGPDLAEGTPIAVKSVRGTSVIVEPASTSKHHHGSTNAAAS